MKGATAICLVTAVVLAASASHADSESHAPSKNECVAAHSEAQRFRREGHLRQARAELLSCASPACPGPVTAECVPWLAEVERALPTVVFEARAADGSDAVDVMVLVDGEKVQDKLDGRAIPVDPGEHLVRFVAASGAAPVERRVVVAEGEKTRVLRVTLLPPMPARPSLGVLEPVPPPGASSRAGPHWSTYVLGGASVLSFGGFAFFGLTGRSSEHDLDDCRPFCVSARTDPVKHDYLAADVFLGVGIAAAAAAIIVGLTTRGGRASPASPPPSPPPSTAAAQVPSFDRSMLK